jgi:hypothetical protein
VRELEGALKRVIAYSSFHGQDITLASPRSAARSARRAEPADLDREHPEDGRRLLQDPRFRHALEEALARRSRAAQVAMALAKELTQLRFPRSAAISAAAITRPCCTHAGRSPNCAKRSPN